MFSLFSESRWWVDSVGRRVSLGHLRGSPVWSDAAILSESDGGLVRVLHARTAAAHDRRIVVVSGAADRAVLNRCPSLRRLDSGDELHVDEASCELECWRRRRRLNIEVVRGTSRSVWDTAARPPRISTNCRFTALISSLTRALSCRISSYNDNNKIHIIHI